MKLKPADAQRFRDAYVVELQRAIRDVPYLDVLYLTMRLSQR